MRDLSQVIPIVVASSHPVWVRGVNIELGQSGLAAVMRNVETPVQLFRCLADHPCRALIIDHTLNDAVFHDGTAILRRVRQRFPAIKLIAVVPVDGSFMPDALARNDVDAIVGKGDAPDCLRAALLAVLRQQRYRSDSVQRVLNSEVAIEKAPLFRLSRCEKEVVHLFLSGMAIGDIAARSQRSKQTVSAQKCTAMKKLGVLTDIELVRYGIRFGLAS